MDIIEEIKIATLAGDQNKVVELTQHAIREKLDLEQIIEAGFIPAMAQVGDEFASGLRFIPEMLIAARAMQSGLDLVKPQLAGGKIRTSGKIVLGTVRGDLHDIGKNLVGIMMAGAGLEVIDLGIDVCPEKFVKAAQEHQPQFLGLSALLTTTMSEMPAVVKALEEAGLRKQVKVLIGGAPITLEYAQKIGADAYGDDAGTAVKIVKKFLA